jgi:hypothetical protein
MHIAANTFSDDFPTVDPIQPAYAAGGDGLVARISADRSALEYGTYLGGTNSDGIRRLALDSAGSAFVTGSTLSEDFPTTPGAYQEEYVGEILGCEIPFLGDRNCHDMFVTRLSPDGSDLAYSTYLGGTKDDEARGIAVDSGGGAHVVGYTFSDDFPLSGGCFGCIIAPKLDANGSDLLYAFVSSSGSANAGHGITADDADATYITGAINVPADIYVAKITDDNPPYDTMHVANIPLRGRRPNRPYAIWARVTVQDQNGDPVERADVTIGVTTALDPYRQFTRPTHARARALFSVRSWIGGYWEVCVSDIVKDGFTCHRSQNLEVCDSINYP